MPTSNPRLSVTLTPEFAAVFRELSTLTGNSQSGLVSQLLEQSLPVLERMIEVLRAAATIKDEARTEIARGLQEAHGRVEAQMGLVLGDFESTTRPILEAAEKIQRRAGRAAAETASLRAGTADTRPGTRSTPISNRGVTPLVNTKKAKR